MSHAKRKGRSAMASPVVLDADCKGQPDSNSLNPQTPTVSLLKGPTLKHPKPPDPTKHSESSWQKLRRLGGLLTWLQRLGWACEASASEIIVSFFSSFVYEKHLV